jgi:hypothetical protein
MRATTLAVVTLATLGLAGCGDPVDRFLARGERRDRVVEAIAAHPEVAPAVIDRMLASDSTRALLIGRIVASGDGRQALLIEVARDRSLLDGTIQFAMQDPETRGHMLTLLRGMQMGTGSTP